MIKQRTNSKNFLLEIYRAGGSLTLIFNVPGDAPYFMVPYMKGDDLDEEKFNRNIYRLKKQELIEIENEEDGITISLTKKGENKALKYSLEKIVLTKPEIWDKKWRVIVFDIPDELKVARNGFRALLDRLGFITVQKSIYAHPFECKEEIKLVRSVLNISQFVKIMTVEDFEGEERFLSRFGLSK